MVPRIISVVTVAGICNTVGGGVLFDIPPRCRCQWWWRVQYAPCIACQLSVPFPFPHASSQCTRQPPPPLLIIRCSTTRRDRRGGRSRDRWPRSTAHKSTDRTSSPRYKIPFLYSACIPRSGGVVRRRLSFSQRRMVRYRQPYRLLLSCGLAAVYLPASNLDRNAMWETAEDIEEEFSIFRPKF